MRRAFCMLMLISLGGCTTAELQADLAHARRERDQAQIEAQRVQIEAEKLMLQARELKLQAEMKMQAQCAPKGEAKPKPVDPSTLPLTVLQGEFKFSGGRPTAVSMHVAGMGIDETFKSDSRGRIAVELPAGNYQVSLTAKGYRDRVLSFDLPALPEGKRHKISETLERASKSKKRK